MRALGIAVCLVVISAGVVLRFTNIDFKPMWADEACTIAPIIAANEEGDKRLRGVPIPAGEFRKLCHADSPLNLGSLLEDVKINHTPNGPIFLIIARLWAEQFGNNILALRTLSAIFGVVSLPLMFWLCMELFRKPVIAWTVMTLFAVSPFQVEYANEARTYTFLCCVMILGSMLLSRACRFNTKLSWALYAGSQVLSFYIHLSAVIVTGLHGLAVLIGSRNRFKSFLFSMLLVAVGGVIWMMYLGPHASRHGDVLVHGWWTKTLTFDDLVSRWNTNLSLGFVDVYLRGKPWDRLLKDSVLIGIAGSLMFCARKFSGLTRALILIVPIGFFVFLGGSDLLLGGKRSSVPRYFLPFFIWTQVAVGATIASGLVAKKPIARVVAVIALLFVGSIAIASSVEFVSARQWWTKWSFGEEKVCAYVRTLDKPLLVFQYAPEAILYSHLVDPDVPIYLNKTIKSLPWGYTIVMPKCKVSWVTERVRPQGFAVTVHPTIENCCTLTK